MTLLVDPPPRDNAGKRTSAEVSSAAPDAAAGETATATAPAPVLTETAPEGTGQAQDGTTAGLPREPAPGQSAEPGKTRLAEPPLTGGRVEALMGELIRVLSHSRLAQPLPAVLLSALGLAGAAFNGLCATDRPDPNSTTPPVVLPLTSLAHNLGAPHLPSLVASVIMYISIGLCVLGLAMMLWANSRGWSPSPRKVFWTAAAAVAVLVNISPVGSGDVASYAAYGRIAALGYSPYTFVPAQLPGPNNPYTALVSPMWRGTPSVYGPVATWEHLLAASIGGEPLGQAKADPAGRPGDDRDPARPDGGGVPPRSAVRNVVSTHAKGCSRREWVENLRRRANRGVSGMTTIEVQQR